MATKQPDFEASMQRLEEIVRMLDGGTEGLDRSLKLYEEGIKLVRICTETLDKAEQKVKQLSLRMDGSVALTDFNADGEDAE